MTSPALTSLFFNSAMVLICALTFAATSALSRGQIVPTADISVAIVPRSALAILTLTTGVVFSSSAGAFLQRQIQSTNTRRISKTAIVSEMIRI